MSEVVPAHSWVQIESTVLSPDERSPHLPEETAACPLVLWVKGFLKGPALVGDMVEIETIIGRTLSGKLLEVNPPYEHTFGRPIPELLEVRKDFRSLSCRGGAPQ